MNTQSAAQRRLEPETATPSALRLQAAERLAAHRARRADSASPDLFTSTLSSPEPELDTRAGRIAAAVAGRYAQTQSYRAFLAAEAERATERAQAAAEVARRTAEAVAAVQMQLLEELEAEAAHEQSAHEQSAHEQAAQEQAAAVSKPIRATEPPPQLRPLSVRLYEVPMPRDTSRAVPNAVPHALLEEEDRMALDEEIAFRQAPRFDDFQQAAIPLPANLIEFPRQLVAVRKARPRLAEGPLRDEEERVGSESQLRIFEVEPELISTVVQAAPGLPEWTSIRLDACPVTAPAITPEYPVSRPHRPSTAPVGLRVMAMLVDGLIVLAALLGFITVAALVAGELPGGQVAGIGAAVAFGALLALFHVLCFTFSDATPGMRYARVGLCTLEDENPTRSAIRRRLVATLLAACPLGLGLLWVLIDDEGLGWHDRISRMYPRSY